MTDALVSEVLSGVPMPLVLVGRDDRIHDLNDAARELFDGDMMGRHFLTAIRQPDLIDAIVRAFNNAQTEETQYVRNELNGETIYRVICTPIGSGKPAQVLTSFEDMTPLATAGQMRRDFVANVSHELRTPLTAILGFVETLRGPAKNDEAARERFLEIMEREATRMNRLVDDLLSLSRVEAEERMRPREEINVPQLVESVCLGLQPVANDQDVKLTVAFYSDVPPVLGDNDQLRQVFTNLIENAIKYGGKGCAVDVSFTQLPRDHSLGTVAISVSVSDNGAGIDAEHLHRLTERFYRADSHRSHALGGTGLGLAIVKHILNRHRGRLKIESTPGEGSRFSAILPIER